MTTYIAQDFTTITGMNGDDILFVARDITMTGQYISGNNNFFDIAGTVVATLSVSGDLNETLVEETGQIRGFNYSALFLNGVDNTVTNYGLIDTRKALANDSNAIDFNGGSVTGGSGTKIDNYGVISSDLVTIRHKANVANTEIMELNNHGVIKGVSYAVLSIGNNGDYITNDGKITGNIDLSNGADRVVNAGAIIGDIMLGDGTDLYDGSEAGGSVTGTVFGGTGADQLYGGSKNDIFDGGSEADYLDGGRGVDTLIGGTGNDSYIVDNKSDLVIEAAGDTGDIVYAKVSYVLDSAAEIESLVTINSSQTTKIDLTGNDFVQTIIGNEASNILMGEGGNDVLQGFGGNDTLNGGAGADTMYGGFGDDIYYVNNTSDIATEVGGGGTDLVKSSTSFTLFTDVENLTLTGTSKINGTGNSGTNIITGNSAHNVLKGAGGADIFVFNTALVSANYDTISDYSSDDKFQIDNSVFVGLKTGALASSAFKAIASATSTVGVDGTDRILYDKTHGDLYFDQDGSGSTFSRIKFAHITENMAIDNTDFLVI